MNNSTKFTTASSSSSLICLICNKAKAISDPESGEVICSNCGMVISDKLQESNRPEWRSFNTEEVNNRSRTGAPTSLARHDMGLATIIGNGDRDASGNKINVVMQSAMERLRTWDFRSQTHSSTDRNLLQAFSELDTLKDKLGLPDAAVEKTAYMYRKAQERGLVKGRTISSVMASVVYIACRELGISRTLNDVALAADVRHKIIARTVRQLILELDFKVPNTDPMKCIARVANKANLSEKTKRQAISIMNDVKKKDTLAAGKHPMSLAATVLYLSCIKTGGNIKQDDIANAAGITGVTLRNRLKDLKAQLKLNQDKPKNRILI